MIDERFIRFQITEAAREILLDPRIEIWEHSHLQNHVLRISQQFAIGEEPLIEEDTVKVKNLKGNLLNAFRNLVVEFCPSLNFGWLTPEYDFKTITNLLLDFTASGMQAPWNKNLTRDSGMPKKYTYKNFSLSPQ